MQLDDNKKLEKATSGTADTIDHISGCAGELLSDVEGFCAVWDGGAGGDVGASVAPLPQAKRRLGDRFVEHLRSVCDKRQHLPVANHFNSPSHSLGDMSI
eukprot:g24771.t1